MLIYCKPEAEDYYASRINADQYTYELYSAEKDERGQRVWAIFRFLLDEDLMKGIKRLYKENMDAIPEYVMKAYLIDRTGLMTREQVCQILKKSGVCQSPQSK